MRLLAAMLLIIALSSAQFEQADQQLVSCERSCCTGAGGSWGGSCNVASLNYTSCRDACLAQEQRTVQGMSLGTDCCGPGFLLSGVVLGMFVTRSWKIQPL